VKATRGEGVSPPLQVLEFVATRPGDADRGPLVRMRPDDAARRLLTDGELAWVYGPRRHELATVVIDDTLPRGTVVVRDVAGVAPSEIVRVVKLDADTPRGGERRNV
jgi:anaerobic selenocysteine-containing dehydrogenase